MRLSTACEGRDKAFALLKRSDTIRSKIYPQQVRESLNSRGPKHGTCSSSGRMSSSKERGKAVQGWRDRRNQAGHCGQHCADLRAWGPAGSPSPHTARARRHVASSEEDTGQFTKTTLTEPPLCAEWWRAAGPTLPPPTVPRRPPRRGVLAAGRAGTAAEAPGPEVSGRSQPCL